MICCNSFNTLSLSLLNVGKSNVDVVQQQQRRRGHAGQRATHGSLQNLEQLPGFQRPI